MSKDLVAFRAELPLRVRIHLPPHDGASTSSEVEGSDRAIEDIEDVIPFEERSTSTLLRAYIAQHPQPEYPPRLALALLRKAARRTLSQSQEAELNFDDLIADDDDDHALVAPTTARADLLPDTACFALHKGDKWYPARIQKAIPGTPSKKEAKTSRYSVVYYDGSKRTLSRQHIVLI